MKLKSQLRYEHFISPIISALKDDLSLQIFMNGARRDDMTRKQYYSRLFRLKELGLVRRVKGGTYQLTSTGEIIKEAVELMNEAVRMKPKLLALDAATKQYKNIKKRDWIVKLFDAHEDKKIFEILIARERHDAECVNHIPR